MRRSIFVLAIAAMLVAALAIPALARGKGNPNPQPVVYVTSQNLAFDSIVVADLPFLEGARYQELVPGGPTGLQTQFGPGDVGYVGGRWFMDTDGVSGLSSGDTFFLCPLLGPGFEVEV